MAPIPRGEDYSKIYSKRLFKINYLGVKYCEKKSISETRIINFNYLIKILNYRQNHSRPLHLKSIYLKTLSLFRIPFKYETTSQHLIELESRSDRHERKRQPVDKVEEILCSKIDETTLNPRYNPGLRLQQDVSLSLPNIREKEKKANVLYIISDVIVRLDKRRIVGGRSIDLKAVLESIEIEIWISWWGKKRRQDGKWILPGIEFTSILARNRTFFFQKKLEERRDHRLTGR